ncbi:ABC transporter permease [uncultured Intestinibacter sp.]|uniref:ABC transporter permease n=1 Tax=uncultured Intestinibacter sp. TaxID=1505659 RepID=UPI0025F8D43F|nr:ABC transporter permease [uncultured Intestinibacter sp.]
MYAKLAKSNARKSIKDYLIYFITITICVSLFYAITSLSSSSYEFITEDSYNFKTLQLILKYSTYVITAILILLIAYVNKYMIRRRQREFATYILLGAEQKSIAFMFFIETLIIGTLAIIAGIFVGTLFSQAITALVLVSVNQEVVFTLRLYMDTVVITFIFFIAMFCIIGLYNVSVLNKIKLIDMLNASKQVEFQFRRSGKVYGVIFGLSILLYIVCVYCTFKLINTEIDYSIKSLTYIGISLVSFIIGTFALFYSISYILIYLKGKCINFKYEGTNLFLIGSIVSKIKTAPILMATIAMTFLGAMISFIMTLAMAQWSLGYLNMRAPYDIDIRNDYSYNFDIEDIPKLDYGEVVQYLNDEGYSVRDYCQVEKYFIDKDEFYTGDRNNSPMLAISLSDFNKLRTMLGYEKINLKENEFTTQWHSVVNNTDINKFLSKNKHLNINGEILNISKDSHYKESIGERIYDFYSYNIIILPDKVCKDLTLAETNFLANLNNQMSYKDAVNFESKYIEKWFKENNRYLIEKYSKEFDITSSIIDGIVKSSETNNILNMTLAMRILGVYLCIVLLTISFTVLALGQLTDSIEHKDRYNVLRKLGVEENDINKIVLKQISIYFVVPIAIALIGVGIFIYNYYLMYKERIVTFIGFNLFIFSIATGIILTICVYMCYFAGTYYTFKRNIK